MKRIPDIIIALAWVLLLIGACSCRSVSKTRKSEQTTVDSSAKSYTAIHQERNRDSVFQSVLHDSSHTTATTEWERETVIEDYSGGAPNQGTLSDTSKLTAPYLLPIGSGIVRRTTIREKGKAESHSVNVRSQTDSGAVSEHSNFDSTGAAETAYQAERKTASSDVERTARNYNWLWLLVVAAAGYWAYRKWLA